MIRAGASWFRNSRAIVFMCGLHVRVNMVEKLFVAGAQVIQSILAVRRLDHAGKRN
jgi:hypothetical protein